MADKDRLEATRKQRTAEAANAAAAVLSPEPVKLVAVFGTRGAGKTSVAAYLEEAHGYARASGSSLEQLLERVAQSGRDCVIETQEAALLRQIAPRAVLIGVDAEPKTRLQRLGAAGGGAGGGGGATLAELEAEAVQLRAALDGADIALKNDNKFSDLESAIVAGLVMGANMESIVRPGAPPPSGGAATAAPDDDTPAAKIRTLKSRGTACFKAGDWSEAYGLYSEALNLAMETGHAEDIHVLFANLSAVLLKGNRSDETLEAALGYADHSCRAARNWPKAYYRRGQALEAKHGKGAAQAKSAYLDACRRSSCGGVGPQGGDKQMEDALVRCGGSKAEIRVTLGAGEDLLEEMIDIDDKRLREARGEMSGDAAQADGEMDLPYVKTDMDDGSGDSRKEQKQMLAQLIGSAMDAESKGDHEHLIKHALAAVKLSAVLGEAPAASFAYVQLSSGFTRMREFRKAEAYAKNALAIAGATFPTSLLMNPEHPLAPRTGGVEIPGLSHPCSSYSLKTQAYIRSTAYLALGNVLSAKLQPSKAIKAFMLALKAVERFDSPGGSPASATIASVRSSLHNNIGNQHSKENMHAEASDEYEQALTLAAEAAGVTGDQAQLQALQDTIAANKARMQDGVGALGGAILHLKRWILHLKRWIYT